MPKAGVAVAKLDIMVYHCEAKGVCQKLRLLSSRNKLTLLRSLNH